ncbi:MAG: DUF6089 family protein, partial [Flavisolibacter sp.]
MRKLFFFFIGSLFTYSSIAQVRAGLFAGIANYQGDLVDKAYQSSRGSVGLTLGYQLSGRINLRAGLTYAKLAGADSLSIKTDLRL